MRNVEIKARLRDRAGTEARAAARSSRPCAVIVQEDVFFTVPHGRLKLRRLGDQRGELIAYQRPDARGPKTSAYLIHRTSDPDSLLATLKQALGECGTVRKTRHLYLVGQTRIHIDRVEGLGDFCELEVVLEDRQSEEEGAAIARGLMAELGLRDDELVDVAYVDLLERSRPST